ncbi:Uncharacterized protein Fot_41175 [Forsythia ovata]|uniref:Uncharacterized protein n=1 Tax=Forsythia ovata TaxID=205694 RepID=A0ABD1RJB8_9LAMI
MLLCFSSSSGKNTGIERTKAVAVDEWPPTILPREAAPLSDWRLIFAGDIFDQVNNSTRVSVPFGSDSRLSPSPVKKSQIGSSNSLWTSVGGKQCLRVRYWILQLIQCFKIIKFLCDASFVERSINLCENGIWVYQ